MMRRTDYIICYDISNAKRLQRVARILVQEALRIQHSVFFAQNIDQVRLFEIVDSINDVIDHEEDDVRIYTVVDFGVALGQAVDLENPLFFI